jgi:hypothetical protein
VPNQQIPVGARESLSRWPTNEPYSVITSKELGLCETILGKEFPSTLEHKQPGRSAKGSGQLRRRRRDVFTLRLLWASLNAFPSSQWTSPAPILGIEHEVYRSFCAVIRRWPLRQYIPRTDRYEAAFASLAPLPLALATRPSYLWTSLWLFELLLAERGIWSGFLRHG